MARARWAKGAAPRNVEAALVKDLGTHFQQELPQIAREVMDALPASERKTTLSTHPRSRHPGGARLHHPGRHHRDPARHHRARAGPAMSQVRDLLVSSARSIFETTVTKDVIDAAEGGRFPQHLWQSIEDSGLDFALVPEDRGGAGVSFADAAAILRVAGAAAAPAPLADSMIARRLLADVRARGGARAAHAWRSSTTPRSRSWKLGARI